jgi:hypothetical protein
MLTGCTSPTTGVQGAGTPSNDVPFITRPQLSLSAHANRPCEIFGVDQLHLLGVAQPGTPDNDAASPRCRWKPDGIPTGTAITVAFPGTTQSLDSLYARRSSVPYFRPTEVAEYPAVDKDVAQGTTGTCTTAVAIAYSATFEVQVEITDKQSPDYSTPCAVSAGIAEMVVTNLIGGG